ncbi:unnamed protein product [Mytilus edulis]|uniref:Uncharacterized protein n=1 Tax=Mytilus edulis TaxID=6550 RepID=A0A8S3QLJ5_MYTED|nr:unnamed protein product [Mytilus edulis]
MAYYNQGGQYQAGYQQGQPPQHGQYYQQQYQHYQQPSQQYGDYGNYFQQSVFSTNAWQAFQFQTPNELQQVFQMELQKNPANGVSFILMFDSIILVTTIPSFLSEVLLDYCNLSPISLIQKRKFLKVRHYG